MLGHETPQDLRILCTKHHRQAHAKHKPRTKHHKRTWTLRLATLTLLTIAATHTTQLPHL